MSVFTAENIDVTRLQATVDLLKTEYTHDPLISAVTASIPASLQCPSFTILRDRLIKLTIGSWDVKKTN